MSGRDIGVTFRITAVFILAAAIAMLGLVGCSTTNPGIPSPTSQSGSGDGSGSSSTTTQPVSDDWWKRVNACTLLDQATATQLGYPQPGQVQEGDKRNCAWTASDGSTFGIVLEGQSYDSHPVDMGQQSQVTVAGRPAVQNIQVGGDIHGCAIAIRATQGSDAFVVVDTLSTTATQACTLAQNVGTAIAPKLPGGSK